MPLLDRIKIALYRWLVPIKEHALRRRMSSSWLILMEHTEESVTRRSTISKRGSSSVPAGAFFGLTSIRLAGDSPTERSGGAIFFQPERGKLVISGGLQVKLS